jgi:hypothetical protein
VMLVHALDVGGDVVDLGAVLVCDDGALGSASVCSKNDTIGVHNPTDGRPRLERDWRLQPQLLKQPIPVRGEKMRKTWWRVAGVVVR